jgi:hypothetical protein
MGGKAKAWCAAAWKGSGMVIVTLCIMMVQHHGPVGLPTPVQLQIVTIIIERSPADGV